MTLVNRLIKEARSKPDHLKINRGQVRTIAAHCHSLQFYPSNPSVEDLEEMIVTGKMKMCGIPVRVGS